MVEYIKRKEENKIEKIIKNAETRMAVYIYIDRNIRNILKSLHFISIGLSFCAFNYKGKRAGP